MSLLMESAHQMLVRLNRINSERLTEVKLQNIKSKLKNMKLPERIKTNYLLWNDN